LLVNKVRSIDMRKWNTAAAILAATVSAAIAQVQGEHPPTTSPESRNECSRGSGGAPPRSDETTGSRSLGDRLAESKGVICPPAGVDPGIAVPPVGGGRTPVIPPPGTPGGDPKIEPR
jgi:hypothetical protein